MGLFAQDYNPKTLTAPVAPVGTLVDSVHPILWNKDRANYAAANAALLEALERTPQDDPYVVWIQRRQAKLARLSGDFDACEHHLKGAEQLSRNKLGLPHPHTLRALVKRMDLEKIKFGIEQSRRRQLFPGKLENIGAELYREPIEAATKANQLWCASLLLADLRVNLVQWDRAYFHYQAAMAEAPDEDTKKRIQLMCDRCKQEANSATAAKTN